MNEPRPRITSARPPETASSVAKRSNTRTGSSELSTVTAEPRRIRSVRAAIAASTTSGAETAKSVAVVLADAEEVDADLIGEHALLDDVADDLGLRQQLAVGVDGHVAERVQAEMEIAFRHRHLSQVAGHLREVPTGRQRIGPACLPQPADALDEELEERGGVEVDADVGVRRALGSQPAIDDRPPAAELRGELDLDVALDRRHEPWPDHLRDGDRVVDGRALPAVGLAVEDGEEVDEVGHERAARPGCRAAAPAARGS